MGRTYQKSRLFLGLTVEDNLYLALLGVGRGHLRPVRRAAATRELRDRARELAGTVGLEGRERAARRRRSPTASSASSRSAMARAVDPR